MQVSCLGCDPARAAKSPWHCSCFCTFLAYHALPGSPLTTIHSSVFSKDCGRKIRKCSAWDKYVIHGQKCWWQSKNIAVWNYFLKLSLKKHLVISLLCAQVATQERLLAFVYFQVGPQLCQDMPNGACRPLFYLQIGAAIIYSHRIFNIGVPCRCTPWADNSTQAARNGSQAALQIIWEPSTKALNQSM